MYSLNIFSYRGPPGWLWCSWNQQHSLRCRHMSQHPLGEPFQCANCHHSSGTPSHSAEPLQQRNKRYYYHTGTLKIICVTCWSFLQVFHLGTSIFLEEVFRPATCRECSGTDQCQWWLLGLLGPREVALQENLIKAQRLNQNKKMWKCLKATGSFGTSANISLNVQ